MILLYVAAATVVLALVLQLAVDRAPDVVDSRAGRSARRMLMAGLAIQVFDLAMRAAEGAGGHALHILGVLVVSFAECAGCLNSLFPGVWEHFRDRRGSERSAAGK